MRQGITPVLHDATADEICDECRGDAHSFILGVQNAWAREGFCDVAFMYFTVWMAGEILRAVEKLPDRFAIQYRRYYGRKLQEIGAAIAGDVN